MSQNKPDQALVTGQGGYIQQQQQVPSHQVPAQQVPPQQVLAEVEVILFCHLFLSPLYNN
jgi:hypothetical protein